MSIKFANLIEDLTDSDGFGNIELNGTPPQGKLSFGSAYEAGDDIYYLMANSGASEWELGRGVMIDETTIRRETIIKSSNANNRVHFSAGLKTITNPITKESLEVALLESGAIQMVTATVQTNVGTKQALLAAVPTGKKRIVTQVVARNASASLATMVDDVGIGFNADSDTWALNGGGNYFALLTDSTKMVQWSVVSIPGNPNVSVIGAAGEVLGIRFLDTAITATLDIDTFYYDVGA